MQDRSERDLVEATRSGDREAYSALVNLHAGRVFAVCLAVVGSAEEAEDLAQEALVQGYLKLGTLKDPDRFGGWIAATAANLSRNFLRVRANRRRLLEDRAQLENPSRREDHSDLDRALERLPEKHRVPLMLYYFDSRSAESIAATLDISPEAVRMRLCRARAELRAIIEKAEANDEKRMR